MSLFEWIGVFVVIYVMYPYLASSNKPSHRYQHLKPLPLNRQLDAPGESDMTKEPTAQTLSTTAPTQQPLQTQSSTRLKSRKHRCVACKFLLRTGNLLTDVGNMLCSACQESRSQYSDTSDPRSDQCYSTYGDCAKPRQYPDQSAQSPAQPENSNIDLLNSAPKDATVMNQSLDLMNTSHIPMASPQTQALTQTSVQTIKKQMVLLPVSQQQRLSQKSTSALPSTQINPEPSIQTVLIKQNPSTTQPQPQSQVVPSLIEDIYAPPAPNPSLQQQQQQTSLQNSVQKVTQSMINPPIGGLKRLSYSDASSGSSWDGAQTNYMF